jgi:hypothetical protein
MLPVQLNRSNFTFDVGHRRLLEHLVDILDHFFFGELQVMDPGRTVHMNDEQGLFVCSRADMVGYGFADNFVPEAADGDKRVYFIRVDRFHGSGQNGADVLNRAGGYVFHGLDNMKIVALMSMKFRDNGDNRESMRWKQ